jgi:Na+-driven multidrug efflux pump
MSTTNENPLGTKPVGALLRQFAIPSIVAMLVSALYNMVDQFFIGRNVGELGNAATNIAFPLSTSCVAIALLFGIGGASAFNLAVGHGDKDEAGGYVGNAIMGMLGLGTLLLIVTQVFLRPMLTFFGASENVIVYAMPYTRITSIGFPFLILTAGGGHLIRADGSPKMSMICNLTGAVINTILDYLFVSVFQWGMSGAATATIIGQIISAGLVVLYFLFRFKTVKLSPKLFRVKSKFIGRVASLGMAPCANQLAMMVVQIVMNKSLKYYGGMSSFGEDIPIACVGIISKVSMVFFAFIIGISQGLQPIVSFNYGAGKYDRVKKGYVTAISIGGVLSVVAFAMFQIFPRNIISAFGNGSEEYFAFAVRYFRIFMFFTFINFIQPISSNFFTAIGKPIKGVFLSLTRQIIFLLPLILILPLFMGIDGIVYAGPIADFTACVVTTVMIVKEFSKPEFKKSTV